MNQAGLVNARSWKIQLYKSGLFGQAAAMIIGRKFLPFLALAIVATSCTTATLTNLTPQQQARNANGFYPVEAALDSKQQTLRWDSIKPMVKVGSEFYPMRPTLLMTNRWEGLIPIPAGATVIKYKFKFDFQYNAMGNPRNDSALSKEYTLRVIDK